MKRTLTTLAAFRSLLIIVFCLSVLPTMLSSCSDSDNDNDSTTQDNAALVGQWYADISGKTSALWNFGPALSAMTFNADGSGESVVYYLNDDQPVGREYQHFQYTISTEGKLTMVTDDDTKAFQYEIAGGQLKLTLQDTSVTYQRTDDANSAQFEQWGKIAKENITEVPRPAMYTMFVYGTISMGPDLWWLEKGFLEKTKKYVVSHDKVRVVCLFKVGMETEEAAADPLQGEYMQAGDVVWFEMTANTDLTKIREEGLHVFNLREQGKDLNTCDPNTIRKFIEGSSLQCPAHNYALSIWGHGNGFTAWEDVPGKYVVDNPTRGVAGDEWNNDEQIDMYELHDAIKSSGLNHLSTLFFHNCMMGNLESLTEVKDCADYIMASAHTLWSGGETLTEFIRGLIDHGNDEAAATQMFERVDSIWPIDYQENDMNGDFKFIRTSQFDAILDAAKHLSDHLQAQYPTQQEAIDRATRQVYRFEGYSSQYSNPFFDIADYAYLLAQETQDTKFVEIAKEMDQAFSKAIIRFTEVSPHVEHLDHYTLSVCLIQNTKYLTSLVKQGAPREYYQGYEQCSFHKYTNWGNWLRMNNQAMDSNPQNGDY